MNVSTRPLRDECKAHEMASGSPLAPSVSTTSAEWAPNFGRSLACAQRASQIFVPTMMATGSPRSVVPKSVEEDFKLALETASINADSQAASSSLSTPTKKKVLRAKAPRSPTKSSPDDRKKRNRESAERSRVKRMKYTVSLEARMKNLENVHTDLLLQNQAFQRQIELMSSALSDAA